MTSIRERSPHHPGASWIAVPRCVAYVAPGCTVFPFTKMQILRAQRGITEEMIREVIESPSVDESGWQYDDERGERLWIVGRTYAGRSMFVVLYPVDKDEGEWRLGTALWN